VYRVVLKAIGSYEGVKPSSRETTVQSARYLTSWRLRVRNLNRRGRQNASWAISVLNWSWLAIETASPLDRGLWAHWGAIHLQFTATTGDLVQIHHSRHLELVGNPREERS
jgi:hypothetical protein